MSKQKTHQKTATELKSAFLSFNVSDADYFRKKVLENLGWSRAVWYNKIHGKTQITPAEAKEIARIKNCIEQLETI